MGFALLKPFSEDDYIAAENAAKDKHEFVNGVIYAMAGATERHNTIALNLAAACHRARQGSGCRPFMGDMRLRLEGGHTYYYPDVMLVCDPRDDEPYFKTSPCMVAEVLSRSTELTDRREKWAAYQKLPSLREYLLLAQDRPCVEIYKRVNLRQWGMTLLGADDTLVLDCVALSIPVRDLYRGVDFSQAA